MIDITKLADAFTPQVARTLVENIKNKVDNIDLGTQSADMSVGYQYSVSGGEGRIQIDIGSGNIRGTQLVEVSDHMRKNSPVRAYRREYENKRVFELPNGEYITSETIPNDILEKAVSESLEEFMAGSH